MNLELLSKGISLGFTAGVAPGPLTLLVITQTLRYNLREGIKVSLAPLFTDLPIIAISYAILANLTSYGPIIGSVCFIGSVFLLSMARDMWKTKPPTVNPDAGEANSVKKGIFSNLLNPAPYLFWLTIGTPILVQDQTSTMVEKTAFVLSMFTVMIGTKVGIALGVKRSADFLQGKAYLIALRVSAAIFVLFALNFIVTGYGHFKEQL